MSTSPKAILVLIVLGLLAVVAVPTFAQDSHTVTITEDQINNSYWVTNPEWRAVTNRTVDLQLGQVVVSETITPRRGDSVAVVITYTPTVINGRVTWAAAAVTADGEAVSDPLLSQINSHMASSWRQYWKKHGKPGHISALDIDDMEITVSYLSR